MDQLSSYRYPALTMWDKADKNYPGYLIYQDVYICKLILKLSSDKVPERVFISLLFKQRIPTREAIC